MRDPSYTITQTVLRATEGPASIINQVYGSVKWRLFTGIDNTTVRFEIHLN